MKKLLVGFLTVVMAGQVLAAEGKKAKGPQVSKDIYDAPEEESIDLIQYLNLNEKQLDKAGDIHSEAFDRMERIKDVLRKPYAEGLKDGKFNKELILKISVENFIELKKIWLDAEEKLYNILNKEQKKRFYEFNESRLF